jgi:stress response protein YsnF
VVPHEAERVCSAPAIDPDAALAEDEQQRLARHYGIEMIRSEEELVTGTTEMRPAERVRLRKVLVTDHVTKTVPVRREEIRLETDPPDGTIERVEDVE